MLKRDISTMNILIAAAGGMIGSGWLFAPFIGAQIAGANALISWIIAAVFMLFIALPFSILMLYLSQQYLVDDTNGVLLAAPVVDDLQNI